MCRVQLSVLELNTKTHARYAPCASFKPYFLHLLHLVSGEECSNQIKLHSQTLGFCPGMEAWPMTARSQHIQTYASWSDLNLRCISEPPQEALRPPNFCHLPQRTWKVKERKEKHQAQILNLDQSSIPSKSAWGIAAIAPHPLISATRRRHPP